MPVYEFQCSTCKKIFEHMMKLTEDHKVFCPDCNKECKKIVSQAYFHASMNAPQGIAPIERGKGLTTKTPIIKDRKTGRLLSGPKFLPDKNY